MDGTWGYWYTYKSSLSQIGLIIYEPYIKSEYNWNRDILKQSHSNRKKSKKLIFDLKGLNWANYWDTVFLKRLKINVMIQSWVFISLLQKERFTVSSLRIVQNIVLPTTIDISFQLLPNTITFPSLHNHSFWLKALKPNHQISPVASIRVEGCHIGHITQGLWYPSQTCTPT